MRSVYMLILAMLCLGSSLSAQTTWTGTQDSDWNNPLNWTNNVPSALNQPAILPTVPANFPPIISTPVIVDFAINNYGLLTISGSVVLFGNILNSGASAVINSTGFTIKPSGDLSNQNIFNNNGAFQNEGLVYSNGQFENLPGAVMLNIVGATFINSGVLINNNQFNNFGYVQSNGVLTNFGNLVNENNFVASFGSSVNNGQIAPFFIPGNIINAGQMTIGGALANNRGVIINNSTFEFQSSATLNNLSLFENKGPLLNAGTINNASEFRNNATQLNDFGSTFDNTGGLFTIGSCSILNHYTSNPINSGTVINDGIIYDINSNIVVSGGQGDLHNSPSAVSAPNAVCVAGPILLPLDLNTNTASISVADIDNGSSAPYCGIDSMWLSITDFDCTHVGDQVVVLYVRDSLGTIGTCSTIVTVQDTIRPTITCPGDMTFDLVTGECGVTVNFTITTDDNCVVPPILTRLDNTGINSGDFVTDGTYELIFEVADSTLRDTCSFTITVNEFAPPSDALACNDEVHLGLGTDCTYDIQPDDILEGEYGCFGDFEVNLMSGNPGSILDSSHLGRLVNVMVTDTTTGISCWGSVLATDNEGPFFENCDADTILCLDNPAPDFEGGDALTPTISDCSEFTSYYYDLIDNYNCDSAFSQKITRIWVAEDIHGNKDSCTQMVWIKRISLADINPVCPKNYEAECTVTGAYDFDPATTGVPVAEINGKTYELNDSTCYLCGLLATRRDEVLSACGASKKILRKWTIMDACEPMGGSNPWSCLQTVKIVDTTPPVIAPIGPLVESTTEVDECIANFDFPAANIDDCSPYSVQIITPFGVIYNNGGRLLGQGFGIGDYQVTYLVTDACGNQASQVVDLTVEDNRPPVPVCEKYTVVSLTSDGTGILNAFSLDDGSTDECCIDRYEVRRMSVECGIDSDTTFGDFITFCCADAGKRIMVTLKVYDCAGNSNICMVEVDVENEIPPTLTCPPTIVLECGDDFEDMDLTGEVVKDPALQGPLDGLAESNCNDLSVTYSDDVSNVNCGFGYVLRTWVVTDTQGNMTSCEQTINIENTDPFDGATDIDWPSDTIIYACDAPVDTSVTGVPTYSSDDCDDIRWRYEDVPFASTGGACINIMRTWTFYNWCVYQPNDPNTGGIWEHNQIIQVVDTIAPVIDRCFNRVFCNEQDQCQNLVVDLSIKLSDVCTDVDDLTIEWVVDAFDDGIPDAGPYYSGTGQNTTSAYPNGTHSICYTVTDECGNSTVCCFQFKVLDCKAPTPVCKSISINLMPSGMVVVPIHLIDSLSSFDNCTPFNELRYSFSANWRDTLKTFTCDNLGVNNVEFWVTDATGNQDYCTTTITVQDNSGACAGPKASIAGAIKDNNDNTVNNVTVQLSGSGPLSVTTDNAGTYSFGSLPLGHDFTVTPTRNDKPTNGVSTFDIVLISKHILNVERLDSPYKIIAADIDANDRVSTLDLLRLRKLVLRVDTELDQNTSWRFVRRDYVFPNPENPFESDFPEVVNINDLSTDELNADFVAIKVGDVNNSAKPNTLMGVDARSLLGDFIISTPNQFLKEGETTSVEFSPEGNESLKGYQFTLAFDQNNLELVELIPGELMNHQNFGLTLIDNGIITVSWDKATSQTLWNTKSLFTLDFKVKNSGNLNEWLSLSSEYTEAEAYTKEEEFKNVVLEFNTDGEVLSEETTFELYQNKPNPFSESTVIGFFIPAAQKATLTVFDVSGKIMYKMTQSFEAGFNEFTLRKAYLNQSGVMYYRLDTPEFTATKKMIMLK